MAPALRIIRSFSLLRPKWPALAALLAFAGLAGSLQAVSLAAWAAQPGVPTNQRGAMDMPAGDGVTNLLKYALGATPLQNAAGRLPRPQLVPQGDGTRALALLFTMNPEAQVRYALEVSEDLATWTEVPGAMEPQSTRPDGTVWMRLRELAPLTAQRRFGRLKVEYLQGEVRFPMSMFTVGDTLDEDPYALPLHTVTVGAFYIAKTHTTWEEWQAVRTWAVAHGYTDLAGVGAGKAATHPVHSVNWYDVVKWCNAKSEMQGLVPCYYTDATGMTVYRAGDLDVPNTQVKWTANGYRLPTESEWECAARGGLEDTRFPWGDTISHTQANYRSTGGLDDVSPTRGYHPTFAVGSEPYTSPVGSFQPNRYGLYDMAGNLEQWCWDWYGDYVSGFEAEPRGPVSGTARIGRGGSWRYVSSINCTAYRIFISPWYRYNSYGFRCVRRAVQ
jgi:formylglycine-generating enzyme required for sulfatase activity